LHHPLFRIAYLQSLLHLFAYRPRPGIQVAVEILFQLCYFSSLNLFCLIIVDHKSVYPLFL
jgi:hypothetical protein